MKRSSDDLDVFFDERHQTLAAELQRAAGEVEKAAAWSEAGEARARAVAARC